MAELSPQVITALLNRERTSVVGRLLRGVVHNVSGALQMLRLPLDLVELQISQGKDVDLPGKMAALGQGVARLGEELDLLSSHSQSIQVREPMELDLGLALKDLAGVWRADMFFKHQAAFEDEMATGVRVKLPIADLAIAFHALLANAIEAIKPLELNEMGVKFLERDQMTGVLVWDQAGPPPAKVAKSLLEPFVGTKGPGHDGLGLFLAAQAVAPWGGEVAWHQGPPKGAVLWLPRL